ncbi:MULTISPECIES: hypothetical protein [unclassified Paenibacillus]|uniref:tetratricopeptide repeat protein n=1 Tax=unclassified Paenibacillus TaxID=185978 RepID=UPI0030CE780C
MENLLKDVHSVFNNINNYFVVEESMKVCEKYCLLEHKMKKCIATIESIIDVCIDQENKLDRKLIYNYFIETSMLMDLIFKTYNIYYKNDKKQKYNSFYKEFESNLKEHEKELLKLQWYKEIASLRNLRIHEYEDLSIIIVDNKLYFQHFDEFEYPTIISEYSDDRFYVSFLYYSVEKLNCILNLMSIIFDVIVKRNTKWGTEILVEKASKYKVCEAHLLINEKYDAIFNRTIEIKNSLDAETKQILRFLRLFERKEEKLNGIVDLIEKGEFDELPLFYELESYFQLSIIKYNNNQYKDGINLLWTCIGKHYNSAFLSNLIFGYIKSPDLISDNIMKKLDHLIEINITECLMNQHFEFFSNASSYYRNTNRESEALKLAQIGVELEPMGCRDLNLLYNYACLLQRTGERSNISKAKNVFLRIIELEPTDCDSYHHVIECCYLLGTYDELNYYFNEAKVLFPQDDKWLQIELSKK